MSSAPYVRSQGLEMHAPVSMTAERPLAAARAALSAANVAAAEEYLLAARDEDADSAEANVMRAKIAMARKQYVPAAMLIRSALAQRPNDALLWAQLGNMLWRCQRYDESREALERALAMWPDHQLVQQNMGLWHYFVGNPQMAVNHLGKALLIAPHDKWIRADHAHAVLKSGDLRSGLKLFEVRWEVLTKGPTWDCGLPLWDGDKYGGTIILHSEQGYGDTLQFIRFVPRIKEAGWFERVLFAGPLTLKSLIDGQCAVDEYLDHERPSEIVRAATQAHCHAPLISAVAQLDIGYGNMPRPWPYLDAPAASPRDLRAGGAKLAVGLVWAASVGHERSRQRSVPITDLLTLGTVPGVRLWSLQMAPHAREAVDTGADLIISDATTAVMSFADMAAIVQDMDAVVTVDTSMVHLCGALGKKCFMLNPVNACWRWALGAAPWYGDAVELFEQSYDLTWTKAIDQIRYRLEEMIALGKAPD